MPLEAWLTIDDSPSPHAADLIAHLKNHGIPALFFCRGDYLEANPAPMIEAVKQGFVLGNHSYAHKAAGDLSLEEWRADFEKAERVIDEVYREAGVARFGRYYRFPYIDRGDGDRVERRFPALIRSVEESGHAALPAGPQVRAMQDYLRGKGFMQPFYGLDHPLYQVPQIAMAADCLFTYSTCDWMLTARHLESGKWPHQTTGDLTQAMDDDPFLRTGKGRHIILLHDQPEIHDVAVALVDHMIYKGVTFLSL